jgi:ceramide glucosyltransferase
MVETLLRTPRAGATFVSAVSDQALQKTGDAFYALLQNAMYAPFALLAAGPKRTLPFIMGQYMLFTRESLQKIGGVACAKGQLVDDMFLGKKLHEAGFVNVIAPTQLSLFSQGLSFKEFIPIYRKWFQFGRNGLPFSFLWRQWVFSICFFASLGFGIAGVVNAEWSVVALSLVNLCVFSAGLAFLHRSLGGARFPFRFWWVPPAILLVSIGVMVLNRFHRKVNWRGHVYELDERAALSGRMEPGV